VPPEWLPTSNTGPSSGMLFHPRTSARWYTSERAQRRQRRADVLGVPGIEPVVGRVSVATNGAERARKVGLPLAHKYGVSAGGGMPSMWAGPRRVSQSSTMLHRTPGHYRDRMKALVSLIGAATSTRAEGLRPTRRGLLPSLRQGLSSARTPNWQRSTPPAMSSTASGATSSNPGLLIHASLGPDRSQARSSPGSRSPATTASEVSSTIVW
jgi:hypothetical protein